MFPVPDHRRGMKWESLTERAPPHRSVGLLNLIWGNWEVNNGTFQTELCVLIGSGVVNRCTKKLKAICDSFTKFIIETSKLWF